MMDPVLILPGQSKQEWGAVLHRCGHLVLMTPKRFPLCGSYEEVLERIDIFRKTNPEWAKKWEGWHGAAIRVDGQVDL